MQGRIVHADKLWGEAQPVIPFLASVGRGRFFTVTPQTHYAPQPVGQITCRICEMGIIFWRRLETDISPQIGHLL